MVSFEDAYNSKSTAIYISGVCQRWRRAALACPSLWQCVAFSMASDSSMECAAVFLKLSGGSPLFLFASGTFPRSSRQIPAMARRLFQNISAHVPRLYACHLFAPPLELRRIWTNPAPNLRRLFIQGDGRDCDHAAIFPGDISHVETLWLADCGLPPLNSLRNLTTLDLGNRYHGSGRLSLRRFLRALEGAPRIRRLILRRFYGLFAATPFPQCVALTQLLTLELEFCDTFLILSHLNLPPAVSVTVNHDRFSPTETIVSCFPRGTDGSNFLSGSRHIDVELFTAHTEYSLFISTQSGSLTLLRARVSRFMREDAWLCRSLEALHSFPPLSTVRSLGIHTDTRHIPWSVALSRLPRLSHLDVRCIDWTSLFNALMARNLDKTNSRIRSLSLEMDPGCNRASHAHLKACVDYLVHLDPPLERISLTAQSWERIQREDPSWATLAHSSGMFSQSQGGSNT